MNYEELGPTERNKIRANANRAAREERDYIIATYCPLIPDLQANGDTWPIIEWELNRRLANDNTKLPSGHRIRKGQRKKSDRTWREYFKEWQETHVTLPRIPRKDMDLKHMVWELRHQNPPVPHKDIAERLDISVQKSKDCVRSWTAAYESSYLYRYGPHQDPVIASEAHTEPSSATTEERIQATKGKTIKLRGTRKLKRPVNKDEDMNVQKVDEGYIGQKVTKTTVTQTVTEVTEPQWVGSREEVVADNLAALKEFQIASGLGRRQAEELLVNLDADQTRSAIAFIRTGMSPDVAVKMAEEDAITTS